MGESLGTKPDQTLWRIEEVEKAGYDWEASKRSQRLVHRRTTTR
jgi:hypothetical protein